MSWGITEDTKRQLSVGEGAFYIEGAGEWFETEDGLIKSCLESGMTETEIEEARDIESQDCFIYHTEFYDAS